MFVISILFCHLHLDLPKLLSDYNLVFSSDLPMHSAISLFFVESIQ